VISWSTNISPDFNYHGAVVHCGEHVGSSRPSNSSNNHPGRNLHPSSISACRYSCNFFYFGLCRSYIFEFAFCSWYFNSFSPYSRSKKTSLLFRPSSPSGHYPACSFYFNRATSHFTLR
jgi:hypothetical protein